MRRLLIPLACFALCACSGKQSNKETPVITSDADPSVDARSTDATSGDAGGDAAGLPNRCISDTSAWSAGTRAFTNQTAAVGFEDILPIGIRISAVDFDGDGFADVFVRRPSVVGDDFNGDRHNWLLRNRGDGTFEDVTQASELMRSRFTGDANLGRPGEVAAFADVDNDGDLDVVTGFSNDGTSRDGTELMWNDGDGTFTLGPTDAAFRRAGEATSVSGLTFADVDRDGRVDLWLGQWVVGGSPVGDPFYAQTANGTFVDATNERGLATDPWTATALQAGTAHSTTWATAACDLDDDGSPELLAAAYGRAPNKLHHARGDGTYDNVSIASGYAFDDRKDWSDNESARCWCTLHPGDPDCAGVPAPTAIRCETDDDAFRWDHGSDRQDFRLGGNSGTTVCGDVDNDGDLDLLTTEIVHWDVGSSSDPAELLLNQGDSPPTFERPGNDATGLTRTQTIASWNDGDITGAMFDFDNDGRLDVLINSTDYPGTRAHLYHQQADGTFVELSLADGLDHQSSHGIGVADFDRDGDLDLVIGHSRFRCGSGDHCYESAHARYFRNEVGNESNWVQLTLEGGDGTNRAAIGARITLQANGLTQVREVDGGHGHYGIQHDLTQHFGLGDACDATITIRWPNAALEEQTFPVQAGYRYHIRQGDSPQPDDVQ